MLNRIKKLREERTDGEGGFTLIELLVVVVIIGILIAIAIPLYLNYKKGANDKGAQSDMRNAVNVLEQCNTDNSGYPTASFAVTASGTVAGSCSGQKINVSSGSTLNYYPADTTATNFLLIGTTTSGTSGKYYCYSSTAGGSVTQKTGTAPTAYAASC
jgi:type IV pilus assembly protein PilA